MGQDGDSEPFSLDPTFLFQSKTCCSLLCDLKLAQKYKRCGWEPYSAGFSGSPTRHPRASVGQTRQGGPLTGMGCTAAPPPTGRPGRHGRRTSCRSVCSTPPGPGQEGHRNHEHWRRLGTEPWPLLTDQLITHPLPVLEGAHTYHAVLELGLGPARCREARPVGAHCPGTAWA